MTRWETYADIKAASAGAGLTVSPHQLRRWRAKGLLPEVRQAGRGRPSGGSETRHPVGTAAQAIAIGSLLSQKEKLADVGWQLWLQGFPVREDHWRGPLENAHAAVRHAAEVVRAAVVRDERRTGKTIYELADFTVLEGTPIFSAMSRLPVELQATAARVAAHVLIGRFRAEGSAGQPLDTSEIRAIDTATGLMPEQPISDDDVPKPRDIHFFIEILSAAINRVSRDITQIQEPSENERRDLMNAQSIAVDLYKAFGWLFHGGLGLRTASRIFAIVPVPVQALMIILWGRALAIDRNIRDSIDIANMARATALVRHLSEQAQDQINILPHKQSLSAKRELRKMIGINAKSLF